MWGLSGAADHFVALLDSPLESEGLQGAINLISRDFSITIFVKVGKELVYFSVHCPQQLGVCIFKSLVTILACTLKVKAKLTWAQFTITVDVH